MLKKILKWLGLGLVIVLLGVVAVQAKDTRTAAEKAFKIGERVVNAAKTKVNIENELGSLAAGIRTVCKDEIEPATGKVISEGYFRYTIDKNTLRVEVDKETGYVIGEGGFSISFSRKCPGLIGDKLLPKSGTVNGTIKFTGKKTGEGNRVRGKYKLTTDLLKINSKGYWTGEVSDDKLSGNFPISVGVAKFKASLKVPFSTKLSGTKTEFDLIVFGVVEDDKKQVNVLKPYKVELKAEGKDEHEFTVMVANRAELHNTRTNEMIEFKDTGVENESITVKQTDFVLCCEVTKKEIEWGTIDNLVTPVELVTDGEGKATFKYKAPDIDEKKFKTGRVIMQALHKDGNPRAYVTLEPQMGFISGKIVTLNGKSFPQDVKLILKDPHNKVETTVLKGGKGNFELETVIPENNYKLSIDPPSGVTGRVISNLAFNVDLGEIVVGTVEDYEKEVIRKTREFLEASGISAYVSTDQLEKIEFVYDQVDSECGDAVACYKDGKVYLQNKKFWGELSHEHLETIYHEIFHGIHSFIAYDEVNWAQELIDQKNRIFFGLGKGRPHGMWDESKTKLWKLNNSELAFDEAISHFMANLMLKEQGRDYLRKDLFTGDSMFNLFGNTGGTADRDDFYQLKSVAPENVNKDGRITEGKIVGFLLDYYKFKGMSNGDIMQDFFITLRDYQQMNKKHAGRDVNDWIIAKIYDARKNNNQEEILHLYEMASLHNIVVPRYDGLGLTKWEFMFNPDGKRGVGLSMLYADLKGKEKAEQEAKDKKIKEAIDKQKETAEHLADIQVEVDMEDDGKVEITTEAGETKDYNVGKTKFKVKSGSSFKVNPAGGMILKSGSVMVKNGPVSTDKAVITDAGTKYLVSIVDGKTKVRVGEGRVDIYNKESGKKYLAEAGEEVEVDGGEIRGVMTFDPKTDEDFKTNLLSLINILLLLGGLVILGIGVKIVNKFKK
ncbi:MAG: hypothetical protein U9Q63_03485 [Patescibacteria group bacterium]|nr:hypothetical protein [Patescibacteria group bacterium]